MATPKAPHPGHQIYFARSAARLTAKALGDAAGISSRTMTRYENGQVHPSGDACFRIVTALGRVDPAGAQRLAAQLGVPPPAAPASPRANLAQAFDLAVVLAADTLDVAPRRVRAAFAQLVLQLRPTGATLDDLAALVSAGHPTKEKS